MSVAGTWQLIIDSPMGKQEGEVVLHVDGDDVTGTLTNKTMNQQSEIFDGHADGDTATWKMEMALVKVTLTFNVTVDGDTMTGKVTAGLIGGFNLEGKRV
ncbi:hypothetical protein [Micromonospora sp. WMMD975]|uniref:hypothetical protein n=1 Tax=Micromonospora sp. WMMD975 TaxID=3016087 RepID=UPI00249BF8E9|nr:hypothetical protein [Micromonospora sp. WMMD975]WFE35222.1 hypothetical protein O7613_07540 [Micromonospora sp. WMMD975]